jgi:hypothetical protein
VPQTTRRRFKAPPNHNTARCITSTGNHLKVLVSRREKRRDARHVAELELREKACGAQAIAVFHAVPHLPIGSLDIRRRIVVVRERPRRRASWQRIEPCAQTRTIQHGKRSKVEGLWRNSPTGTKSSHVTLSTATTCVCPGVSAARIAAVTLK